MMSLGSNTMPPKKGSAKQAAPSPAKVEQPKTPKQEAKKAPVASPAAAAVETPKVEAAPSSPKVEAKKGGKANGKKAAEPTAAAPATPTPAPAPVAAAAVEASPAKAEKKEKAKKGGAAPKAETAVEAAAAPAKVAAAPAKAAGEEASSEAKDGKKKEKGKFERNAAPSEEEIAKRKEEALKVKAAKAAALAAAGGAPAEAAKAAQPQLPAAKKAEKKPKEAKVEAKTAAATGSTGDDEDEEKKGPWVAPEYMMHRMAVWDAIVARQAAEKKGTSHFFHPYCPTTIDLLISLYLLAGAVKEIKVTLPSGKNMQGVAGVTTPFIIAKEISSSLVKDALVAKITPPGGASLLWDMARPLEFDCAIEMLTFESKEGEHTFWHSSAHILGQAMEKEFKDVKLCVGPPVEDGGFYYDAEMGDQYVFF
jgi:hypothetical protein